ncbi:MAG: hypothetical protein E7321_03435 [Clostridiales bacterium]|nr:hypothetical protein [Clostridiales bacterium]
MEEMMKENVQAPLSAHEITGELMEDSIAQEAQEAQELEAAIREGIGMLFEDGWTGEELMALSQDEGVRGDVAQGKDLIRAAAAYLRRKMAMMTQAPRRRGVPVTRASAAGQVAQTDQIDAMSDAQFDEFSKKARAAAMMGKKVRM